MNHLTKNLLYFTSIALLAIGCQEIPIKKTKSLKQTTDEQIVLDSIATLIVQKDWYVAHRIIANFKKVYPKSKYNNKVTTLSAAIRNGLNQQVREIENGQILERYELLTQHLRKERDELKRRTFYHATTSTPYLNEETVKVYLDIPFDTLQKVALHLMVHQVATSNYPLQYVQFIIDGKTHPYLPKRVRKDEAKGVYWQWFDDVLEEESSLQFLKKITEAKSAEIQFYFKQNYKQVRRIPEEEKRAITEVLEVYEQIIQQSS